MSYKFRTIGPICLVWESLESASKGLSKTLGSFF